MKSHLNNGSCPEMPATHWNTPAFLPPDRRWFPRHRGLNPLFLSLIFCIVASSAAFSQVAKGFQILLNRGLQLQGMSTKDDVFQLTTFSNANYTSVNWLWAPDLSKLGPSPGFAWSRWVSAQTEMPGLPNHPEELPYLQQLVSLQIGDEWHLNDEQVRNRAVAWFETIRSNWPNTILYGNNWGGQVLDGPLSDFIARARPDMLCFDTYPFQCDYATRVPLSWNRPDSLINRWYGELRRYRAWAQAYGIPFAAYRQTFHAVQDYDSTVYRDPSRSELRLNTFAALAFNAKLLVDFTYNTGASSLFTTPGGDSYPTALYAEQSDINKRARNLGRALLCLQPGYDLHNASNPTPPPGPGSDDPNFPEGYTTSILFFRGRYLQDGVTNFTSLPNSFAADPQAPSNPASLAVSYSWWEFQKNDPYLSGWAITNRGTVNNGLAGDVILSWMRLLDERFDGLTFSNQVYFMVVNGLTATNGSPADCLQEIRLTFLAAAPSAVVMLDSTSGNLATNSLSILTGGRKQLVLNLNGGDAALFKFSTGAPFVGFLEPSKPQLEAVTEDQKVLVRLTGTVGARYELQRTASLQNPQWQTAANIFLTEPVYHYEDPAVAAECFYRAVGRQ